MLKSLILVIKKNKLFIKLWLNIYIRNRKKKKIIIIKNKIHFIYFQFYVFYLFFNKKK